MESGMLTEVMLPLALAVIMLGMGLSLTPADFKRVVIYPKSVFVGLFNQMLLLPVVAFGLLLLWPQRPELAVGVMILAACPGGATSNLIAHLCHGDTALSITLTAINSMLVVVTIPLIVNFALQHFMEAGTYVPLPIFKTMVSVVVITIIPVLVGMLINKYLPNMAAQSDKPVRILSAVFLGLIILAALIKERENVVDYFLEIGVLALFLNVLMLFLGYYIARLSGLKPKQRLTISIESGLQNGTLGIAIAATLLKNPTMTIPSAIYSLVMFGTAGVLIWISNTNKEAIKS